MDTSFVAIYLSNICIAFYLYYRENQAIKRAQYFERTLNRFHQDYKKELHSFASQTLEYVRQKLAQTPKQKYKCTVCSTPKTYPIPQKCYKCHRQHHEKTSLHDAERGKE